MKYKNKILKYFIFHTLFLLFSCQICPMKNHNFYLIPLIKVNNTEELYGLEKYDYFLLLETDPFSEGDNYHMIFSITFPVNVNIILSTKIIYKFESTRKFCLKDLTKQSTGKQSNIEGRLSEYNSEIQILERIWIKIEKVILYKKVDSNDKKIKFFLLSEFPNEAKKYKLMKKMNKHTEKQFFQIIEVSIDDILINADCLPKSNNILKIGTEFTIQEYFNGEDFMLREGITYETFALDDTVVKSYNMIINSNLLCLIYEDKKYGNKCFSNTNNK